MDLFPFFFLWMGYNRKYPKDKKKKSNNYIWMPWFQALCIMTHKT